LTGSLVVDIYKLQTVAVINWPDKPISVVAKIRTKIVGFAFHITFINIFAILFFVEVQIILLVLQDRDSI
jgi:hypothetical protein